MEVKLKMAAVSHKSQFAGLLDRFFCSKIKRNQRNVTWYFFVEIFNFHLQTLLCKFSLEIAHKE